MILPVLTSIVVLICFGFAVTVGRGDVADVDIAEWRREERKVYKTPVWMTIVGVWGMAVLSVGLLVWLFILTASFAGTAARVGVTVSTVLAALLTLTMAADARIAFVEITADEVRARSLCRSVTVKLVDIDHVSTYKGSLAVTLKDGPTMILSATMGWPRLTAELRSAVVLAGVRARLGLRT